MSEKQIIKLSDYGDGQNSKLPPSRLKPSEAFLVFNLRTLSGTLEPRKDKIEYANLGTGLPVHSLALYEKTGENASKYLLAGSGNKIFSKIL